MELKTIVIDEICKTIGMGESEKLELFSNKYKDLYAQYPHIIKKACEVDFDVEKFKWMISMQESVKSDFVSKHNADITVGERLVDEHIKPKLAG
jgi:hypothetical protein